MLFIISIQGIYNELLHTTISLHIFAFHSRFELELITSLSFSLSLSYGWMDSIGYANDALFIVVIIHAFYLTRIWTHAEIAIAMKYILQLKEKRKR